MNCPRRLGPGLVIDRIVALPARRVSKKVGGFGCHRDSLYVGHIPTLDLDLDLDPNPAGFRKE